MSTLTDNLQSIYNTKLEIKSAIGTQSDIFADYPSYITAMKPSGAITIPDAGDYDVSSYAYAYVTASGGSTDTCSFIMYLGEHMETVDYFTDVSAREGFPAYEYVVHNADLDLDGRFIARIRPIINCTYFKWSTLLNGSVELDVTRPQGFTNVEGNIYWDYNSEDGVVIFDANDRLVGGQTITITMKLDPNDNSNPPHPRWRMYVTVQS